MKNKMGDQLILDYLKQKANSLGYSKMKYLIKDITISPDSTREINSYSQIHYILQADKGMSVVSDLGEYDRENPLLYENSFEHSGRIIITNNTIEKKAIQFVHLILIK